MTLNQLIYFKTITEYGSLAKASKHLFVSRSALSKALKELEEELGTELFVRTGNTIILNKYGKKLLEMATPILESIDKIKPEIEMLSETADSIISVDTYYPFAYEVLSPMLLNQYHNIRLDLKMSQRPAEQIIKDVKSGKLDCAVIGINDPEMISALQQNSVDDIESIHIFNDQLYLAVPKNHNVYKKKSIKVIEIMQDRFVTTYTSGHVDHWFQSIMNLKKIPLGYRHTFDQNTFLKTWTIFDYDFITDSTWASNELFCKDFNTFKDLIKIDEPEATEQIMFIYNKNNGYIAAVKDDVIRDIYHHFHSKKRYG